MSKIIDGLQSLIIPIGDIRPDPANARIGHDIESIADSLNKYGQRKPIVVNAKTGVIEAGNGTYQAAKVLLGWSDIAAVMVEDDPLTATGYAIADNRLTDKSSFDLDILGDLLKAMDDPLEVPGIDLDFLSEIDLNLGLNGSGPGDDTKPQIDRAEELRVKWGVEVGQLWRLGEHRLICGDCTDKAVVERVMGGEPIDLLLTDIPYDVSQAGRFDSYNFGITKAPEFEHFDKGFEPTPFLSVLFDMVPSGANWFIFVGAFHMGVPVYKFLIEKLDVCSAFVWVKKFAVHNISRVGYAKAYEMALYAWDKPHYFDVLEGVDSYDYGFYSSNEGGRSYYHATSKPLKLFDRIVKQLSDVGYVVLDPFSGSGTTLIAAHNLARRARCIEIDPGYVAVTLQRFLDHTGIEPELIS